MGRIGVCSGGTQPGDLIMTLYGRRDPVVLRPRPLNPSMFLADILIGGETFDFIGTCYLEGTMDGEIFNHPLFDDPLF
jgi:hypothetical protein